jgi:hypothetical protein
MRTTSFNRTDFGGSTHLSDVGLLMAAHYTALSSVTLSLSDPHILVSAMFSNTDNLFMLNTASFAPILNDTCNYNFTFLIPDGNEKFLTCMVVSISRIYFPLIFFVNAMFIFFPIFLNRLHKFCYNLKAIISCHLIYIHTKWYVYVKTLNWKT